MELCDNGSLKNYLLKNRGNFIPQVADRAENIQNQTLHNIIATNFNNKENLNQTIDFQVHQKKITQQNLISWAYQIARGMQHLSSLKV